jgi:hypothetical protein
MTAGGGEVKGWLPFLSSKNYCLQGTERGDARSFVFFLNMLESLFFQKVGLTLG